MTPKKWTFVFEFLKTLPRKKIQIDRRWSTSKQIQDKKAAHTDTVGIAY